MSRNREYAEKYAEFAMEQMKRYGIPASVTLAQGILESSNGQSELSRLGNNHFGIKSTPDWIKNGGAYLIYTDDKPDEKFCKYDSVGDSYEHHSRFLKNNKRYADCFKLSPDDYKGWTNGIARAGYASGSSYARNLQKIIENNGLHEYDRIVMKEMQEKGLKVGTGNYPRAQQTGKNSENVSVQNQYSFPLDRKEFLLVTSPFGNRTDPLNKDVNRMHSGLDIRCSYENLLATEDNGKVVAINQNSNTGGGKSVTVEYERENGNKYQCTYMHMSQINVKKGDVVNAGQILGVSGNTGTRTTGAHLHFGVKLLSDGNERQIDPAAYLAEIAEKGNIDLQVMHNGKDLLTKYKTEDSQQTTVEKELSPEEWMKKLLSSEDSGIGMGKSNDPIIDVAMSLFTGLMLLASQIDSKTEEEKMQAITDAATSRKIDLSSLLPQFKQCEIVFTRDNAVLTASNGTIAVSHEMSDAEKAKISQTLGNGNISEDDKRQRIAGIVNGIILSQQMSQNYEQGIQAQQERSENLQIK